MSVALSLRWPPLTSTWRGPAGGCAAPPLPCRPRLATGMSASTAASCRLGVTTWPAAAPLDERGRGRPAAAAGRPTWRSSPDPGRSRFRPVRAAARRPPRRSARSTACPILIASAPNRPSDGVELLRDELGRQVRAPPVTPTEFCAVTAVSTDMPNTRNAENVLRSAWMPAPPPESDPAIVSALGDAHRPAVSIRGGPRRGATQQGSPA